MFRHEILLANLRFGFSTPNNQIKSSQKLPHEESFREQFNWTKKVLQEIKKEHMVIID